MQLRNTTAWSNRFVLNLSVWTGEQVDYDVLTLKQVKFCTKTALGWNGRAWWHQKRILVRLCPKMVYPVSTRQHGLTLRFADDVALAVFITAHELQHLVNHRTKMPDGRSRDRHLREARDLERDCHRAGLRALAAFEDYRAALLEKWNSPATLLAFLAP